MPVLIVVACLLLIIGTWAIATLAGMDFWGRNVGQPGTKKMAVAMLLTIPLGLMTLMGAYLFVRMSHRGRNEK